MTSSVPPSPPRPIYTGSADDDRIVPPNWLAEAPVTRALLALNVAVFLVQAVITRSVVGLPERDALALGASYTLATLGEHRYETLITACFLHDGFIHLGFNMLALWQAGPLVERAVGSARMAPMYLFAGALGYVFSVAHAWLTGSAGLSVGASGAISGVIAAALIVGWRVQGWRGPLTQAMARWLGFVIAFGVLSGARIDNAAHVGGALAGVAIASLWRRGYRYSDRATKAVLAACAGIVVACIAVVAVHDRTDRFATMTLRDRFEFTSSAVADGRCVDARAGLLAVQRLRAWMAPVTSLRSGVETVCGRVLDR